MYCRNLLLNSSFELDDDYWLQAVQPTIKADNAYHAFKCAALQCRDTVSYNYMASKPVTIIQGHKCYAGFFAKGTKELVSNFTLWDLPCNTGFTAFQVRVNETWQLYSSVTTIQYGFTQANCLLYSDVGTAQGSSNSVFFDAVFLVDLTEAFGAGKEPSKEWCDTHIFYEGDQCRVVNGSEVLADLTEQLGVPLDTKILHRLKLSDGSYTVENFVAFWMPVFDRVLADCVYGNPKGCFDSAVFNRIEYNMQYLSYMVEQQGYYPIHYNHEAVQRDFYLLTDTWNRLKLSILNCKEFYAAVADFPAVSFSEPCELVDYVQINKVEYMQWLLYKHLSKLVSDAYCVNDMYVGEYMIGGVGT